MNRDSAPEDSKSDTTTESLYRGLDFVEWNGQTRNPVLYSPLFLLLRGESWKSRERVWTGGEGGLLRKILTKLL